MNGILHRKFGLAICLALMLSLILSGVVLAAVYPCEFYGTVKVDGVAVPDGTAVTAWAENLSTHVQEQVGATTTVSTPVAGYYDMTVSLDPATHSTTIYFKIGAPWNQWANETGTWVMYGGKELDLTVGLVVAFSAATYSVGEGDVSKTITVNLSAASAQTVTVNYATGGGTATAGSDYTAASGMLTFSAGQTSKTFSVSILEDVTVESNETVNLSLTSPTNAALGTPHTAVLTIVDNDAPPLPTVAFSAATYSVGEGGGSTTITVNLSAASAQTVTVNYATSGGTATAGSDYTAASGTLTFSAGQTSKTFSVSILEDALVEGDETVNLSLTSPTNATLGTPSTAVLTIVDNEVPPPTVAFSAATYSVGEGGGSTTITVNLSAASAQTVTVNYATSGGTATAGSDYTAASGTLTFSAGQTSKTFSVSILEDALVEGNETVNLSLTSPSNATLGTPNTAVLTIVDNDVPPPTVAFSAATYSVGEGGGSATITVNLSAASAQTVTVNYATGGGTATAGSDYTAASGTLTFSAGQTSKTFSVSILEDALVEGNETVNLSLTSPSNATLGTPNTAVLTIIDNEVPVPTADFTGSPQTGVAPLRVSFTNLSTGADEWVWEFGDGGTSTAQNPTHTYTVPGVYTVTLTATGPGGSCEVTKERYIRVLATAVKGEPPKLTATWLLVSPEQVLPNQEVLISINIGNQGGSDGSRTVALYINGYLEQSQTVTVSPGSAQNVVFRVSKSTPGTYQVSLEGKEGQFFVIAPPEAPTTNYFPGGLGTGGIIVIIVVVIVLIVAVVFLVRRQTLT